MTIINRPKIAEIRTDITEALKAVGDKHGIKISTGSASFSAAAMTMKLEIVTLGDGGVERDLDAEAFTRSALNSGLSPSDLGKTINLEGRPLTIAGYRPKARKHCIVLKSPDGLVFVASAETVRRALGSDV